MALQLQGNSGVVAEVLGTIFRALCTNAKPAEYGTGGAYRVGVTSGTLAAALAANAQVYQFAWTSATHLAIIWRIKSRLLPLTPFTAATLNDHTSFDGVVARSYAAGGGGTLLTLTGNNAKQRTNMAASQAAIRISTTAALTAATTLDTHPFVHSIRKGNRVNPAAATEEVEFNGDNTLDFEARPDAGEHPLVLAQNEGFVIRNRTVWPAAGTGILSVECVWSEVLAY